MTAPDKRLVQLLCRFSSAANGWVSVKNTGALQDYVEFIDTFMKYISETEPELAHDYSDPDWLKEAVALSLDDWNEHRNKDADPENVAIVELVSNREQLTNVDIINTGSARERGEFYGGPPPADNRNQYRDRDPRRPRDDAFEPAQRDHWVERSRDKYERDGWDHEHHERKRRSDAYGSDRSLRRRTEDYDRRSRHANYEAVVENAAEGGEGVPMKAEMPVKKELAGAVIGRGGETVSRIRRASGAHVHICEPVMGESERIIELFGNKEQVEEASKLVRQVMMKEDPEYTRKHGHIFKATVELQIVSEMVGCLIGKGGGNVKNIKNQTRATVQVEKPEEGENTQTVHIYGSTDEVLAAHKMVMDILQGFEQKKSRNRGGDRGAVTVVQQATVAGSENHREPSSKHQPPPPPPSAQSNAVVMPQVVSGGFNIATLQPDGTLAVQQNAPQMQQTPQTAFIVQTPGGMNNGAAPTILVLQADGSYQPTPVIYQTIPTPPVQQQSTVQTAPAQPTVLSIPTSQPGQLIQTLPTGVQLQQDPSQQVQLAHTLPPNFQALQTMNQGTPTEAAAVGGGVAVGGSEQQQNVSMYGTTQEPGQQSNLPYQMQGQTVVNPMAYVQMAGVPVTESYQFATVGQGPETMMALGGGGVVTSGPLMAGGVMQPTAGQQQTNDGLAP